MGLVGQIAGLESPSIKAKQGFKRAAWNHPAALNFEKNLCYFLKLKVIHTNLLTEIPEFPSISV